MILANTWKNYFTDTLATRNDLLTEFHHFATSLEHATTPETRQTLLTNTLFKFHAMIGPLDHKVHFCHNLSVLTGNNWGKSEPAYVALLGLGSIAQPVVFEARHAFAAITTTIPNYDALHDHATTPEQLSTLHLTATTVMNTNINHLVQVPPFLFNVLTSSSTDDPAELFFLARLAAKTFAENQANLSTTQTDDEKAAIRKQVYASAEYFLSFLYTAKMVPNQISLPISYATTHEIMDWSATLHRMHINSPKIRQTDGAQITPTKTDIRNSRDESMAQVAAALVSAASNLATNTDRLVEARSSNTPSSSRAWEKQPKFLQDQILRLMAAHDDDIITEPIQSLATFLSLSSNTSAAQQFMAEYLQSILNCQDLRLDPFTTLCISQLQFNYDPTEGPSRISLFKLLSESNNMVSSSDIEIISNATIDAAGDSDRYNQIMKRLSDKKLLIVAKTVADFETTIKNMIAIVLFVLGNCFTADRLCTWLTHIEANRATYRHCSDLDFRFFAHQLTIMDNMIQAFWRNSRYARSVQEMDFQLLDFSQQQRQIAVGNPMTSPLHPRVAALFLHSKRTRDDQFDENNRRHQQQGNRHQQQENNHQQNTTNFIRGRAVTNPRADILFRLPTGIFYRDAFPPSVLRKAPRVNGATNCCRWQISGICIDNCDRKDAHVQLTGDNKKAFATFFTEAIRDVTSTTPRSSNTSN